MLNKYKNILKVIGTLIAVSLILYVFNHHHLSFIASWFNKIHDKAVRDQTIAVLVGAVIGAIGSGGGIWITDTLRERRTRDHNRRLMHYNALVKLQWQSNVFRAVLEDNVFTINQIIEANDNGVATPKRPQMIDIDHTHFENLYDLKLINMINDFYYDARRLNLDACNLTRILDNLTELFLSQKIDQPTYKLNLNLSRPQLIILRDDIRAHLDNEVMAICAYVRICINQDATPEMRKRFKRMTDGRKPITGDEVRGMKNKIIEELKQQEVENL